MTNRREIEEMSVPDDLKRHLLMFQREVSKHAKAIDPDNEHDWRSLTLGWALAKGFTPDAASEFASFVRYNTDLA